MRGKRSRTQTVANESNISGKTSLSREKLRGSTEIMLEQGRHTMDSIQLPLPHGLGHLMPALCKNTTAHQGNNIISTLVREQRKERKAAGWGVWGVGGEKS